MKTSKEQRDRMKRYRDKPEIREKMALYQIEYRKNPANKERLDKLKAQRSRPEYLEGRNDKARLKRVQDPDIYRIPARNRAKKRRQFLNLLKLERPCYDCGGMFPPEAMDWDHLPGKEKVFAVGVKAASVSLEKVLEEIAKCQLVCATCHRIRTKNRKQEGK